MSKHRAFTLIELLVVVSIIALLIAIAMPSIAAVRRLSNKTFCKKNLEQIGVAMHAYLVTNRDTFPYIARLPSYEGAQARKADREPYPTMAEALHKEIRGGVKVFACPADENTMSADPTATHPILTRRYYDNEGTSYEWESQLNGLRVNFKTIRVLQDLWKVKLSDMWMMFDFEAFHGGPSKTGSLNSLYVDLHVASDRNNENRVIGESTGAPPL